MISRRTITIWALLVLGWLPLPAGSPTVVAVDPEQGFVDTDTHVVVSGGGLCESVRQKGLVAARAERYNAARRRYDHGRTQ